MHEYQEAEADVERKQRNDHQHCDFETDYSPSKQEQNDTNQAKKRGNDAEKRLQGSGPATRQGCEESLRFFEAEQ